MNFKNSLIISSLFLLSSCTGLKKEDSATDASVNNKSGTVLLSINGKPVMYENEYESFYNDFINSRQDIQQFLAMNPGARDEIRKGIFNELALQNLFYDWVIQKGINYTPEYVKDRKLKMDILEKALAMNAFQQDLMKNAAISDEEAEQYYSDNRDKVAYFRQAPFVKTQGGIKAESVIFDTEKSAQDFAARAKKAGANFRQLARDAKKKLNDLGVVHMQSPVDAAIRIQLSSAKDMPGVIVVKTADKKFAVVRPISKQESVYSNFNDVKDSVKEVILQTKLPEIFKQKVEDLKKQMNVVENLQYFENKPEVQEESNQQQAAQPKMNGAL